MSSCVQHIIAHRICVNVSDVAKSFLHQIDEHKIEGLVCDTMLCAGWEYYQQAVCFLGV